jgi:outer membrane protein insertion porin family
LSELPVDFELPFIASVRARVGYAESFGSTSEVPIDYRFYVGGDTTVRGFQWGEAGPKDKNGDPEGANRELIFNFELGYDVTKFLRLLTFLDVGGGWWDTYKIGDMRKGAGVGIRVLTPIGPIRLDIGWKLDRKTGESSSEWHFGLGSYF